ncbi:MAG: phosphoethanolamine transferase [Methanobrevibacter sp.]
MKRIYISFVVIVHNALIITEFFIFLNFQKFIDQDIIDIVTDTNPIESSNFINSYILPHVIITYILGCLLLNIFLVLIIKYVSKIQYNKLALAITIIGFFTISDCCYNFVKYRNGKNIPQLTTITRLGYSIYCVHERIKQTKEILNVCHNLKVEQNIEKKPTVVVIIGESFSVYHSSLYGYSKKTNPLLENAQENQNLIVFDNAVTLQPFTTASMCADFSLDSLGVGYTSLPMFPSCFKKAGYYTAMYDNQYFVGSGISFLTDKELSDEMFDYRNNKRFTYDEDMIKSIHVNNKPSLYVIHLWGQHYTYKERYPNNFQKFTLNQYDKKYDSDKQQIIANYDNATLYNDYVVNSIFNKFKDEYCIIFYFSDHGEEVYDLRNFMGHGRATDSPNANYQLRVPFMIWLSPSYKIDNPKIYEKLNAVKHYPICMDDIGHTLIDIVNIKCKGFAPTRSFINNSFNKRRHRIVLTSVDYDADLLYKR